MRDVREVMRLHREGCVPMREIARMYGLVWIGVEKGPR